MFKTCGNPEYSTCSNSSKSFNKTTAISLKNNSVSTSRFYNHVYNHTILRLLNKLFYSFTPVKNELSTLYTALTIKPAFLNLTYKYNNKETRS